jgi:uncharacterized lipoprotein YddW (UPF0748 family)
MNELRRLRIGAVVGPLVTALGLLHAVMALSAQRSPEVRALWVTRTTLSTPDKIGQMVRAAREGGFNTLIVQVRGRGDAYYHSALDPRATELTARQDFDPLAEVLARATPAGLSVHAWINANLVSSAAEFPTSRQHVIYRHPEWLMVPRELAAEMAATDPRSPEYLGRLARWTRARLTEVEGLYASPLHPAAAAHVASIAAEIVSNYAVDGLHLDYARFPNADFDYSRSALLQFKHWLAPYLSEAERQRVDALELVNPSAYANMFPERWQSFRQSRITSLVMRVRTAVKQANPAIVLSAAVGPDLATAAGSRMQDWRTWLDQSLVDVLCPMAYTQDVDLFGQQISIARDVAGDRPVWAGVGAYRLSPPATLQHIEAARHAGAAGVVLFSYDALVAAPNSTTTLAALGRAAFGATGSR